MPAKDTPPAAQLTLTREEALIVWLGLEKRPAPKSQWSAMNDAFDLLEVHNSATNKDEGRANFDGPVVLQCEKRVCEHLRTLMTWYEDQGAGRTLARRIESIASKVEAAIIKLDKKQQAKDKTSA